MASKVIDLTGSKDTTSLPTALSVHPGAKKAVLPPTALPSERQLALTHAIQTAQPKRVRQILQNLCGISETNEVYVAALLLTTEEGQDKHTGANATAPKSRKRPAPTDDDDEQVDEAGDSEAQKPRAAKRFRARYVMCTQCGEEFDVTENDPEACVYHPGM
jgi:hypothetical protein